MENAKRVRRQTAIFTQRTIDGSIIKCIVKRGGRVTARELQRGPKACRSAAETVAALRDMIDGGLGHYVFDSPKPAGGRPSPVFVLNEKGKSVAAGFRRPKPARPPARVSTQRIAADVVHYLNRYSQVPCEELVLGLNEAVGILSGIASGEDKDLLKFCPRRIRVRKGGVPETTWQSPR